MKIRSVLLIDEIDKADLSFLMICFGSWIGWSFIFRKPVTVRAEAKRPGYY